MHRIPIGFDLMTIHRWIQHINTWAKLYIILLLLIQLKHNINNKHIYRTRSLCNKKAGLKNSAQKCTSTHEAKRLLLETYKEKI
jgi:hypothetical protein